MRKPRNYYSLMRPKLRLSWNKHNVYNIARSVGRDKSTGDRMTFFQMKWDAKSRTRGYHGDHITEKKWKRMFSHRLLSAVDLPPRYLAENDGSEQAAGRGSGVSNNTVTAEKYAHLPQFANYPRYKHGSQRPSAKRGDPELMLSEHHQNMTPYMQMAYAPLERRLDMAVFRALFASSVRQARQFIIHGAVQVNGKKMNYPAYQLNPGDMFQVEVEKVLFATGVQKQPQDQAFEVAVQTREKDVASSTLKNLRLLQQHKFGSETAATNNADAETTSEETTSAAEADAEADAEAGEKELISKEDRAALESLGESGKALMNSHSISNMMKGVSSLLKDSHEKLSAKDKKKLRLFKTTARSFLSLPPNAKTKDLLDSLQAQYRDHRALLEKLIGKPTETPSGQPVYNNDGRLSKILKDVPDHLHGQIKKHIDGSLWTNEALRKLAKLVIYDEENPVDESKPYATPWRPRPFMSAFAFIPRYLEVNHQICAAVYLRHPVARKGMAEVPTPFSYLTNQLAHNWYLQRGPRDRT